MVAVVPKNRDIVPKDNTAAGVRLAICRVEASVGPVGRSIRTRGNLYDTRNFPAPHAFAGKRHGGKQVRDSRMMRKTSLVLLGAATSAALTLIATQPQIVFDGSRAAAAAADTYRQLSL